jgi:protocatechuate 3,4-dioxygenase beta subunit
MRILGLLVGYLMLLSTAMAAPPAVPRIAPVPTVQPVLPQTVTHFGRPDSSQPGIVSLTKGAFGVKLDGTNLLPSDDHATVSGKVIDLDHDTPIEGAVVLVYHVGPAPQVRRHDGGTYSMTVTPTGWVMTNGDGTFTAKGLEPGRYHLEAYQPEIFLGPWLFDTKNYVELSAGENRQDVNLKVYEGHVLTGTVRETETGNPIAGARLGVSRRWIVDKGEMGTPFAGSYDSIATDEMGHFTIHGVTGTDVAISIWGMDRHLQDESGRRLRVLPVQLSAETRAVSLAIDMFPPPHLTGRITNPEGEPISAGEVAWQPGNIDDLGRPTEPEWVPLSPNGEFTLTISQRSFGHLFIKTDGFPLAAYGTLRLDESIPEGLSIQMQKPGTLDLLVRSHDDRVVDGIDVLLSRSTGNQLPGQTLIYVQEDSPHQYRVRLKTEVTGYARVDGLTPGDYRIEALPPLGSPLAPNQAKQVTVKPGEYLMESITLAPFQRYLGRVRTEEGEPISEAAVILSRLTPQSDPQTTITNAEGLFEFESVAPPEVRIVEVNHPEFSNRQIRDVSLDEEIHEVILTPEASGDTTVLLTVRDDETGELVTNATVKAPPIRPDVIIDELTPGMYRITSSRPAYIRFAIVEAPGYAPLMISSRLSGQDSLELPSELEIEARLKPANAVRGRIVDGTTGDALAGVRVIAVVGMPPMVGFRDVSRGNYNSYAQPQTTETDSRGTFSFDSLAAPPDPQTYFPVNPDGMLLVVQPPAPWMELDLTFSPGGEGTVNLGDIALSREGPLTVTVTRGDEAIPGAEVIVDEGYVYPNRDTRQQHLRQSTDGEGRATFPLVRSRHLRVRVPSIMQERRVTFDNSEAERTIDVEAGTATLELTVTNNGVVQECDISLTSASGLSAIAETRNMPDLKPDDRGLIRVHSIPEGEWRLSVSGVEGSNNSRRYSLNFEEGEARYLHVEMEHGSVSARVVDGKDSPVEGARFAIAKSEWEYRQPSQPLYEVLTSADGAAVMEELPAGTYNLIAWRRLGRGEVETYHAENVSVTPGGTAEAIFRPSEEPRTLRIRAIDRETGLAIPNVSVNASLRRDGFSSRPARTGPMGEPAVLSGLPAGDLFIRSWAETHATGYAQVDLSIEEPDPLLMIEMTQGGRLEWIITTDTPQERPIQLMVSDAAQESPLPGSSQYYSLTPERELNASRTLAEGTYRVAAYTMSGEGVETTVAIMRGEITPLRMELKDGQMQIVDPIEPNEGSSLH